jgi:hypothetical protein
VDGATGGGERRGAAMTAAGLRRGARAAFAITLGLAPFGLVVGVVADARGLSLLETLLMSGLVFAGTSQLVALELWSDPAPVVAGRARRAGGEPAAWRPWARPWPRCWTG